jgi:membrane associated rhomboid family serine protease
MNSQATGGADLGRLHQSGPLDAATADALLQRGDQLVAQGDFGPALPYYQRVVGASSDPIHSAHALYGLGGAFYRLDHEDAAQQAWQQVLALPETPFTYRAWREIAAMKVREHDLPGAQRAYREAERRAPPEDRAEIASRLGWLAKETGDARGASRYFARSRAGTAPPYVTIGIIAITSIVSVLAFDPSSPLFDLFVLDKVAVAHGEYWRLFTVTLLHASWLHLLFNMYALWLAGSLVEQLYGPWWYLLIYLICAAAGSLGSFLLGGDVPSVGASGAIFGLFGVLLAVSRTHRPVLDRRGQMVLGQIGGLIVLNLLIGFGFNVVGGNIDNFAHLGGLLAGLWLGFVLVPGRVQTLGGMWQRPSTAPVSPTAGVSGVSGVSGGSGGGGAGARVMPDANSGVRIIGVLALVLVIVVGVAFGTQERQGRRPRAQSEGAIASPVALVERYITP